MLYENLNSESLSTMMRNSQEQIETLANNLKNEKPGSVNYGIYQRNLISEQANLEALSARYQGAVMRESAFHNNVENAQGQNSYFYCPPDVSKGAQVAVLVCAIGGFIAGIALPIIFSIIF